MKRRFLRQKRKAIVQRHVKRALARQREEFHSRPFHGGRHPPPKRFPKASGFSKSDNQPWHPKRKFQGKGQRRAIQMNRQKWKRNGAQSKKWNGRFDDDDDHDDDDDYFDLHPRAKKPTKGSQYNFPSIISLNEPSLPPWKKRKKDKEKLFHIPRERQLQKSLKHFLREDIGSDSSLSRSPSPPRRSALKPWKKGKALQKKRPLERNHLNGTSEERPARVAEPGMCLFGNDCPDKGKGCPFLHGPARGVPKPLSKPAKPRCAQSKPALHSVTKNDANRQDLETAKLKEYARALARLEAHAGRPLYDPRTGEFDIEALQDPNFGAQNKPRQSVPAAATPAASRNILVGARSASTSENKMNWCHLAPLKACYSNFNPPPIQLQSEPPRQQLAQHLKCPPKGRGAEATASRHGSDTVQLTVKKENHGDEESDEDEVIVSEVDSELGSTSAAAPKPCATQQGTAESSSSRVQADTSGPGWTKRWDDVMHAYFYVNFSTKTLRWEWEFQQSGTQLTSVK